MPLWPRYFAFFDFHVVSAGYRHKGHIWQHDCHIVRRDPGRWIITLCVINVHDHALCKQKIIIAAVIVRKCGRYCVISRSLLQIINVADLAACRIYHIGSILCYYGAPDRKLFQSLNLLSSKGLAQQRQFAIIQMGVYCIAHQRCCTMVNRL